VKIKTPSSHAVLINTQQIILVTFRDNIPEGKVYKLVIPTIHCLCDAGSISASQVKSLKWF